MRSLRTWDVGPILLCGALLASCANTPNPSPSGATATAAPTVAGTAAAPVEAPSGPLFPLVSGKRYTFAGAFRGSEYTNELELRAVDAGGEKVFYFADVDRSGDLTGTVFGMGAFAQRADGLYTADALQVSKLKELPRAAFQRMLALPASVGAKEQVSVAPTALVPGKAETYRVAAFESVTVPAGTFPGCLRLVIDTIIDGEKESSTVWLAPSVGPVKLQRSTGRVDQLVKVTGG